MGRRNRNDGLGRSKCTIDGCDGLTQGHGYCGKHYYKFQKYGNPLGGREYSTRESHGKSRTGTYRSYRGMLNRCYNPSVNCYSDYGGRGIGVCERWRESFLAFLEDMGERPFANAQIDRIDNNGDYTPQNCRWVDNRENSRNKRNSILDVDKVIKIRELLDKGNSAREIADKVGVSPHNVRDVRNKNCFAEVLA